MSEYKAGQLYYVHYGDFLDTDPRRRGDALEFGRDWQDGEDSYRVCWYEGTGEFTAERIDPTAELDLEDFHSGIVGPVQVLGCIPTRQELTLLIGEWPNIARSVPRTLARLRELLLAHHCPGVRA
ncbi:MAG: hypothetical protein ACRDL4_01730 [Thermoleophilaceae bacterium]